jgi:hypothetical protein
MTVRVNDVPRPTRAAHFCRSCLAYVNALASRSSEQPVERVAVFSGADCNDTELIAPPYSMELGQSEAIMIRVRRGSRGRMDAWSLHWLSVAEFSSPPGRDIKARR